MIGLPGNITVNSQRPILSAYPRFADGRGGWARKKGVLFKRETYKIRGGGRF